jgi:hypothetical protein
MGLWYDFHWERDAIPFYDRWATVFAVLAVLYLPVIFSVQYWMKDRKPFNLKPLLLVRATHTLLLPIRISCS